MQFYTCATAILLLHGHFAEAQQISESLWGESDDGGKVRIYELSNSGGMTVQVAEYGAMLLSIRTADRDGKFANVILAPSSLEEAISGRVNAVVIGRFANRISGGGFTIDEERFDLESVNERTGIHIHGGRTGFQKQIWNSRSETTETDAMVEFSLQSADGHEGYPGAVEVTVTYRLCNDDSLRIEYAGTTDAPTHLNLTNHAYFNLRGCGDIGDHLLNMTCDEVLEFDGSKIPTGKMLTISGSPFDFCEEKPVGAAIDDLPDGIDHCFVITKAIPEKAFATLTDPVSGRIMEVATTKPGVQIYTANHLKGNPFPKWGGICFETQYYPDTPNRPEFPTSLLRPGENYEHVTEFRFRHPR